MDGGRNDAYGKSKHSLFSTNALNPPKTNQSVRTDVNSSGCIRSEGTNHIYDKSEKLGEGDEYVLLRVRNFVGYRVYLKRDKLKAMMECGFNYEEAQKVNEFI